jgi:ankyrin repeat protein/predicted enzyme related to lactoylglutathione lyase
MNTTSILPLPAYSLDQCTKEANNLLQAWNTGGEQALQQFVTRQYPVFLHLPESKITRNTFVMADAQFIVARSYGFESWAKLAEFISRINQVNSPVAQFESAVDAIITGDIDTLRALLQDNPELVHIRSMRVHHSSLLHYTAANGVEDYRQQTPGNIVAIAQLLLDAGSEVDAPHPAYSGGGTTLGLAATSMHPAEAGVMIGLLETLYTAGAAVDGLPGGWAPLMAALANGQPEAAAWLADHGASMNLVTAAALGRLDLVRSFFNEDGNLKPQEPGAAAWNMPHDPHLRMIRAFVYACGYGHADVVAFFLDKGVHPFARDENGDSGYGWAVHWKHPDVVELLVRRPIVIEEAHIVAGRGQLRKIMPEFPLTDVAAGVTYFRDVLGFSINYAQHDIGVMDRDEVRVLLIARTEKHQGIGSCYVYIRDADALYTELKEKGATVLDAPVNQPWGLREFYVLDPEGNRIGFGQTFEYPGIGS